MTSNNKLQHPIEDHLEHARPSKDPKTKVAVVKWLQRLSILQMFVSLLMQTTYVAFPGYNFSLAIWSSYITTSYLSSRRGDDSNTSKASGSSGWTILGSVVLASLLTDGIWTHAWTMTIFPNRLCASAQTSILSCGGIDHFPGCRSNQFAFAMLVVNVLLKVLSIGCIIKLVRSMTKNKQGETHDVIAGDPFSQIHPLPSTDEPTTTSTTVVDGEKILLSESE